MLPQALLGLMLASAIGYLAYRRRSLSLSGALGAVLVGTVTFGLGGWAWGLLLITFFVSSSGLSRLKAARKEALAEKFSKGSQRDLAQTLANGGVGALIVIANVFWPHPAWWAAFAGALATVNADTWATELGVLSPGQPRLVTSGRRVAVGTSGAVSWMGSLAALAGAGLIGLAAGAAGLLDPARPAFAVGLLLSASLAGLLGALFDSYLGATAQAIYFCDACGQETERHPLHTCGTPTRALRGWRWLDNDWVNFVSSAAGAALGAGLWLLLAGRL